MFFKRFICVLLVTVCALSMCGCSIPFSAAPLSAYTVKGHELQDFDLYFLKSGDGGNVIYSPLSIKYALSMLKDAAGGKSAKQIGKVIGDFVPTRYAGSDHLSLANAFFVRDSFAGGIKPEYTGLLSDKYGAELYADPFTSAGPINSWIEGKTFGLIPSLVDDDTVSSLDFALVNALAIDMEWEEKFLDNPYGTSYSHENYWLTAPRDVLPADFEGVEEMISGMEIVASVNNYDIIGELGEDSIRATVGAAFREYLDSDPYDKSYYLAGGKSVEQAEKEFLDEYIESIGRNYGSTYRNTDFSLYVDDKVKVFGKDLKEYDGTTLTFIAVMPKTGSLADYVKGLRASELQKTIDKMVPLENGSFKEGVITKIVGYVPKFTFEYSLPLMDGLKNLGITDVFDPAKADLSGMTDADAHISTALHKANIEFTQDGIKAAAATVLGGLGAGDTFDYLYDVPVEEIDMTFDRPYLFLIADKDTGDVWFTGAVYEPLLWTEDSASTGQTYQYYPAVPYDYDSYIWSGNANY